MASVQRGFSGRVEVNLKSFHDTREQRPLFYTYCFPSKGGLGCAASCCRASRATLGAFLEALSLWRLFLQPPDKFLKDIYYP